MNAEDLKQKLLQARMALEELKGRLEGPRKEFLALLKQFLAGWADATVRAAVRIHSGRVVRLGRSGMHAMKEEYDRLLQGMPEVVDETFSSEEYWPHLRKARARTDRESESEPENTLDQEGFVEAVSGGVREIQGRLGALLIKHGFASSEDPADDWGVDAEDREAHLRFKHESTFTNEMNAALDSYWQLYQQMLSLRQDVQRLDTEREDKAAEDIWEQA